MRNVFILSMLCLMTLYVQAQRCAVLDFKAGSGISQADVDGISAIFITYFRPAGYTMVERSQIDKVIDEQGFQRSSMTENQMVRISQILNVSKVVAGDVNVVMGQYNVDVRVINVETGTVAATEGATFASNSSYRTTMQSLAQNLAKKIAITPGNIVQASTPTTSNSRNRNTVEVIYGYLKVFPNELGVFQSEPTSVIANINNQVMHGYNNWRIPTNVELSLMHANGYIGSISQYMTCENKRGIVLLVTDGEDYETIQETQRKQKRALRETIKRSCVDLGLPSGTLWKDENEGDRFYNFLEAWDKFQYYLPTKEQFEELINHCVWSWTGRGYNVTGPNGNSIFLPAEGYCNQFGTYEDIGARGYYWSSTIKSDNQLWRLGFFPSNVYVTDESYRSSLSVRLVLNKE